MIAISQFSTHHKRWLDLRDEPPLIVYTRTSDAYRSRKFTAISYLLRCEDVRSHFVC